MRATNYMVIVLYYHLWKAKIYLFIYFFTTFVPLQEKEIWENLGDRYFLMLWLEKGKDAENNSSQGHSTGSVATGLKVLFVVVDLLLGVASNRNAFLLFVSVWQGMH